VTRPPGFCVSPVKSSCLCVTDRKEAIPVNGGGGRGKKAARGLTLRLFRIGASILLHYLLIQLSKHLPRQKGGGEGVTRD